MNRYLNLSLPDDASTVSVKLDDEGVVVDVLDDKGEVVASTWKTYVEFGRDVWNDDLRREIREALEGDSNDAEHDALVSVAQSFGIDYTPYDDLDEDEDDGAGSGR